jgi:hypothetical protein
MSLILRPTLPLTLCRNHYIVTLNLFQGILSSQFLEMLNQVQHDISPLLPN